jgi:hypothetical protein
MNKECNYCQGFKPILDAKGFFVELDNNNLCVSYHDKKTGVGSQWTKKIKNCPMCGRKLGENE